MPIAQTVGLLLLLWLVVVPAIVRELEAMFVPEPSPRMTLLLPPAMLRPASTPAQRLKLPVKGEAPMLPQAFQPSATLPVLAPVKWLPASCVTNKFSAP